MGMWRLHQVVVLAVAMVFSGAGAAWADELELLSVERVSDEAPHSAFTDLIRYDDHFYLAFREGEGHVSPDGAMRVMRSADGDAWESVGRLEHPAGDLRDAALSITPEGELMLLTAVALHEADPHTHQPVAWYSEDGQTWSDMHEVAEPDVWLWQIVWHPREPFALGFGYSVTDDRFVRLYRTEDGREFDVVAADAEAPAAYPNESAIIYREDDTAVTLLRQDPGPGLLGEAQPPYEQWEWRELDRRIGGPAMVELPDGRLLAVVRLYDHPVRTGVCWVDPESLTVDEVLTLPSGGDTSYAGLVYDEGEGILYVSYYASHEERSSIYFARVRVE